MKRIALILLVIWIILWANFIARDLYRKRCIYDYRTLIKKDAEGKRAYVYGEHFYELLKFAKSAIPPNATYGFIGVEDFSLAWRRGIYYLYPYLKKENPDYLLVYNVQGFKKDGFHIYAKLDKTRFILKRDTTLNLEE